jgi:alpha-beta hydrolase superfamily lysophospholipase
MTRKKKKIIIWIIAIFFTLTIAVFTVLPFIVMNQILGKHVDFEQIWKAEDFELKSNHFFVKTEDGLNISAYEVETDTTPKAVIICLSGIHNPSATVFFGHARFFRQHGYATVLFDMRAHGESDGENICVGYKEYLDTKAVVNHIKEKSFYKNVPIVVFGLSMGGATAINSTGEIAEIDGLISLSAYSSFEDVFYEQMSLTIPVIIAKLEKPFVAFTTLIKFGNRSISPKHEIKKLGNRPALLMHTKDDSQVSFANFERIMKNAPAQVETFVREGDNHFVAQDILAPETDSEYAETLLRFLDKYFGGK